MALPQGIIEAGTDSTIAMNDVPPGIIYIPNYMMHEHGRKLSVDLTINAMSLAEMWPQQISYYVELMTNILSEKRGIFADINANVGVGNGVIDPHLCASFTRCHPVDLRDLACAARLWINDAETASIIGNASKARLSSVERDLAFRLDWEIQYPDPSHAELCDLLNRDFGDYIEVDGRSGL